MNAQRKNLVANFEARSVMLIASWTLGAASAAMAQNMPAQQPAAASENAISAAFVRADKNADGKLNREEATALPAVAAQFDTVDGNADGSVSAEEFAQAMKKM